MTTPERLHGRGRFRAWLGGRFGGDAELGDRIERRLIHCLGAFVLLYFVLPTDFFIVLPTLAVILLALAAVFVLEFLRHTAGLELPTLRSYESHRVGSYVFYAVALVIAVLAFPRPIATVVILGSALVDPLVGELRLRPDRRRFLPHVPVIVYAVLGASALVFAFGWALVPALVLVVFLGAVAVLVEEPRIPWLDDDLIMTLVPGIVGTIVVEAFPALPRVGL
ncbi:MAG: hypothetical protein WCA77_06750 [Thermoplasmata archaeon]